MLAAEKEALGPRHPSTLLTQHNLANLLGNELGEVGEACALAADPIDPDRFVWVIVGDASVVEPQLEQLGLAVERVEMAGTE